MSKNNIHISESQLSLVRSIIRENLPFTARIWVFGSRATGICKPFSDLDLAIKLENNATLDLASLARLHDAFDNSTLPWKVDLVDYNQISNEFRKIVDATSLPL